MNFKKLLSQSIILILLLSLPIIYLQFQPVSKSPAPVKKVDPDLKKNEFLKKASTENFALFSDEKELFLSSDLFARPVPTNRPWSSVVFSGQITGLYSFPYAFRTEKEGLRISIPEKVAQEKAVVNNFSDLYISITGEKGIHKTILKSYNDLSTVFLFQDILGVPIFEATVIQGSPYIFITPLQDKLKISSLNYNVTNEFITGNNSNSVTTLKSKNSNLALFSEASVATQGAEQVFDFTNVKNKALTIGVFTDNKSFDIISDNFQNQIYSAFAGYDIINSDAVTEFNLNLKDPAAKTVFGLLPHQVKNSEQKCVFTLDTIRGTQCFIETLNKIIIRTERIKPIEDLDISNLAATEREKIRQAFLTDIKATDTQVAGSYFGGKSVARLARLVQIADSLKELEIKKDLLVRLEEDVVNWLTYTPNENGKYFSYDEFLGGLIAQNPEFGLEDYNDHHFQYGYLIFSAGVLAKYKPEFVIKYKSVVDLIVQDIANTDKNDANFPYLRVFDFYESHSWASGFGKFADGNNQESTSEAVNAWYAVWLWSKYSGNENAQKTAEYLYSSEINSANYYWLNRSKDTSIFPKEYKYNIAGIVWGGKYDFATFFSGDISAIYGIQVIPITAGSTYLYNPEFIKRDGDLLLNYLSFNEGSLVDMLAMYIGVLPEYYEKLKPLLDTIQIDGGNSRSNMYTWIYYWLKQVGYKS